MQPVQFSVESPDPSDKRLFAEWNATVLRQIANSEFTPRTSDQVFVRGWMGQVGRVQVGRVASSGGRSQRGKQLVQDDDDRLNLILCSPHSEVGFSQHGQEMVIRPGGAGVISMDRPVEIDFGPSHDAYLIFLPRKEIEARLGGLSLRQINDRLSGGLSSSYLTDYLNLLAHTAAMADEGMQTLMANHVIDLVLHAIRQAEGPATAGDGIRALRRQAIDDYIARHFRRPDASIDDCSRVTGLSRSYVQRLLEECGTSFSVELRRSRVTAACFMLARQECSKMSIADIGFNCGFADLSTFNRAFRAVVDETPSAFRQRSGQRG